MSYTQFPLGIDKAATPYNVGTLLNGTWRDFATLSSLGAFIINSTSGGAGTVSGVMAANGAGVVSGVSGTSGHTVPWLDGTNTWSAQQTFSAAPVLPLTTGSIPFIGAGGVLSQDNAKLFWDDTNNKLGIGTVLPQAQTQIVNLNYQPTATNFLGNPSGVPNGVGNGMLTSYVKRTGGVGQYGYVMSFVEVEAESAGTPGNRSSDNALTSWISANNDMTGGRINSAWIGANSPATANGHSFSSGTVSAMEINYGNISADFGIRTVFSNLSSTIGLIIAPDPVPNTEASPLQTMTVAVGSPAVFTKVSHGYSAGMGIEFVGAGAIAAGLSDTTVYYIISTGLTADDFRVSLTREGAAVNLAGTSGTITAKPSYPGTFGLIMAGSVRGHQVGTQIHIQQDGVRPGGYGIFARGTSSGSNAMAPGALLSGNLLWGRGIDLNSMTFVNDAIRLADDQILRLGSANIKGLGAGSINITTGGTGTTGRLLGNGGAQEVIRWGANGTPVPVLSFYGAAPVVRQDITGAKGGNAALADLLTKLALMGLITDSTT